MSEGVSTERFFQTRTYRCWSCYHHTGDTDCVVWQASWLTASVIHVSHTPVQMGKPAELGSKTSLNLEKTDSPPGPVSQYHLIDTSLVLCVIMALEMESPFASVGRETLTYSVESYLRGSKSNVNEISRRVTVGCRDPATQYGQGTWHSLA